MAVRQGIFIVFVFLTVSLTKSNPVTTKAIKADPEPKDYRLDENIVPDNYAVDLTLDENFGTSASKAFKGVVKIKLSSKAAISGKIILNAEGMTLSDTVKPKLYKEATPDDNLLSDTIPVDDSILQRITFTLKKDIVAIEPHIFEIEYSGTLYEDMYGFYLSTYYDKDSNKTETIATTQFQPAYARRAFPCFDEPNFKATFVISITHPADYRAISNAGVSKIEASDDGKQKNN